MASMMPGTVPERTLASALTRYVGPTTNGQFSRYFPTLVTPPNFVFLVWPLIAITQTLTLLYSCITSDAALDATSLTSLSLANVASAGWLFVSSRATPHALPLASCLVLPLVPLFSGYPLRNNNNNNEWWKKAVFQLYAGFTTLASFLALAVELQHGRFSLGAEWSAMVFLVLCNTVLLLHQNHSIVTRLVQATAIGGIFFKRARNGILAWLSPSFWYTLFLAIQSIRNLRMKPLPKQ